MTDRPIIMSGPMVCAILDGRKTQTRRVLKPQPDQTRAKGKKVIDVSPYHTGAPEFGQAYYWQENGCWNSSERFKLPYAIGDRLWVRETWAHHPEIPAPVPCAACFKADKGYVEDELRWRPSIHMPRWASRLTLLVTDVRVQRVQEISAADAIAEGIPPAANSMTIDCDTPDPRRSFQTLWNSLNAKRGYSAEVNPWVVALTFTAHQCNIDSMPAEEAA